MLNKSHNRALYATYGALTQLVNLWDYMTFLKSTKKEIRSQRILTKYLLSPPATLAIGLFFIEQFLDMDLYLLPFQNEEGKN